MYSNDKSFTNLPIKILKIGNFELMFNLELKSIFNLGLVYKGLYNITINNKTYLNRHLIFGIKSVSIGLIKKTNKKNIACY